MNRAAANREAGGLEAREEDEMSTPLQQVIF